MPRLDLLLLLTYVQVQRFEAPVLLQCRGQGPSVVVVNVFVVEVNRHDCIGKEVCAGLRQYHRCRAAGRGD